MQLSGHPLSGGCSGGSSSGGSNSSSGSSRTRRRRRRRRGAAGFASLPGSGIQEGKALMAASTVPSAATQFVAKGAILAAWEEAARHVFDEEQERNHTVGLAFREWERRGC
jgi:hypothetical protein